MSCPSSTVRHGAGKRRGPREGPVVAYSDWTLRSIEPDALTHDVPRLARALVVPPLVSRLLWLRGIRTEPDARRFLQPQLRNLRPPATLPNMARAAARLADAVRNGERIAVCGDYDVDGMSGTALLMRFFQLVDADAVWSIPDREADGYGLNAGMIDDLAERDVRVVVTVDNGMRAHDALAAAQRHGMDVVVTDHHLPGDDAPHAFAVVNPHLGDASDDQPLCGCALGFKLAWAVADRLRMHRNRDRSPQFKAFLRDALGLVALATLSDLVPLVEENRILVSGGLNSLRASDHAGLRALCEVSRVGTGPISTEDVAFRLAPRLNAAGRLSRPDLVIDLLTETDTNRCQSLAKQLDRANAERKRIEEGVREAAFAQAQAMIDDAPQRQSLVVAGRGWHLGVIGIVAARLVDRFGRPTVVIGFNDERGRGSCRTPKGIDLNEALAACAGTLRRFGGHAMAAGLEVAPDDVPAFRQAFEAAVGAQRATNGPTPSLEMDAESHTDDWTLEAVRSVRRLEPFGAHNPEPVFWIRDAQTAGRPKLMGANNAHLAFTLKQRGGAIRVVAWGRADLFDLVASGDPFEVAVTPVENTWRGRTTAELRLVDARPV